MQVATTNYRIDADNLVALLFSTFEKSGVQAFRSFLMKHPFVTKWMVSCDFVLNDKQALHDAYVYTLFPHIQDLLPLKARLTSFAPSDFKKTKTISSALKTYVRSGEIFTICLLTPKNL